MTLQNKNELLSRIFPAILAKPLHGYSDKFRISSIATYTMKTTNSLFTQLELHGLVTLQTWASNITKYVFHSSNRHSTHKTLLRHPRTIKSLN